MTNRRNFIGQISAAGMVVKEKSTELKIWAELLHLSANMWGKLNPDLLFDESLWNDALKKMADVGMNMVVIDLGDGVKYESHPEIAVNNAWTVSKLHGELEKIRKMGLEPIPKMNFSTCHDAWLRDYGRMVSTQQYYNVCRDLIAEVIRIFDTPRFFHLGMDEENEANQKDDDLIIIRGNDLYWGDFYFLIGEVFKGGSRPWVWQDYVRYFPEKFSKMMPKSVLQSNWYNGKNFDPKTNNEIKAYQTLEALGYDQVPGGSNYYDGTEENISSNVKFCVKNIADQRLLGFIQSPWKQTVEKNRAHILKSIELAGSAKTWYENNPATL